MSQGRGSAAPAAVIMLTVYVMMVSVKIDSVQAATYTVGGAGGWTYSVVNWPNGKKFKAGDVLVFNYIPSAHNVVAVDGRGYSVCRAPAGAKVFASGNDRIRLVKGQNYFLCSFAGHCESGMKIAVTAT